MVNACALYAARKLFDALTDGSEFKWSDNRTVELDSGVTIHSDLLEEIVEYEYTEQEAAWELPSPYPDQVSQFLFGHAVARETAAQPNVVGPRRVAQEGANLQQIRKPRPDRSGLVSIQTIAGELKLSPRDARAALRKAKVVKPAAGWAWPAGEVDAIRKLLKTPDDGGDKTPTKMRQKK